MRVCAVEMADGSVRVIHPAFNAKERPRRQVGVETQQRVRKVYDFAAKKVVDAVETVEVPVTEPIHTDEEWADRCIALTLAKNPALQGRPVVVMDSSQLPPRTQRNAWRLQNGRVVIQP